MSGQAETEKLTEKQHKNKLHYLKIFLIDYLNKKFAIK